MTLRFLCRWVHSTVGFFAVLLLWLLVSTLSAPAVAGVGTWTALPPTFQEDSGYNSDRIDDLRGVVLDTGGVVLFASADSGTIHRSIDGGQTWDMTDASSVADMSVRGLEAIAVAPDYDDDPTVIIVSSQTYQVFVTQDGGQTWTMPCQRGTTGCTTNALWDVAISPGFSADGTVYTAGTAGVYRSTDRGTTWTKVASPPANQLLEIVISPDYPDDQTLYVGSIWDGIFRSTDDSSSWQAVNTGLPMTNDHFKSVRELEISPDFDRDGMLFVTFGGDLYRSHDRGETWLPLSVPIWVSDVALSPAFAVDHTVAVVGKLGYSSYRVALSEDAGASWTVLAASVPASNQPNLVAFSPDFGRDRTVYISTPGPVGQPALYGYSLPPEDTDSDGIPDTLDNCPEVSNAGQSDRDQDFRGDVCDPCPDDAYDDVDGDLVCGDVDNCPDTLNPDQTDLDGDGVGDACDSDRDEDGRPDAVGQVSQCVAGGAPLEEICNGIDDDCDGEVDESALGVGWGCDSGKAGVCGPGTVQCGSDGLACVSDTQPSPEGCNNLDDDCDGLVDEGVTQTCYTGPAETEGVGVCIAGARLCSAGTFGTCIGQVTPMTEICNTLDDDCDGSADEQVTRLCYDGPSGTAGVGECEYGSQTCTDGQFGECVGAIWPVDEACNGLDDDCDHRTDGFGRPCYSGPDGTEGVGLCAPGAEMCIYGQWGPCQGDVVPSDEICNKLDDDCDGAPDEGMPRVCYDLWVPAGPMLDDGGPSESAAIYSIAFSPEFALDETLFAGGDAGFIYRSRDRGDTWDAVSVGTQYGRSLAALAVSPDFAQDGTAVAASINGYGLFRTIDGGDTWTRVCPSTTNSGCLPTNFHQDLIFSPDYAYDQTIFEAGYMGLHVSRDGGDTWQSIGQGIGSELEAKLFSLAISPNYAQDHTLYAGGHNYGIYRSLDGGERWALVSDGIALDSAISLVTALHISPGFPEYPDLLVLVRNRPYLTSNGGDWWDLVSEGLYAYDLAMSPAHPLDDTIALACGLTYHTSGIRLSRDNGENWTNLPALPFTMTTRVAMPPNYEEISTIYAAGWDEPGRIGMYSYTVAPPDEDQDGVPDRDDNCPLVPNSDQLDSDGDDAGDACDLCPFDAEDDWDDDGWCADEDNCPDDANPYQDDFDMDGLGDLCDPDADGDSVENHLDECPGEDATDLDADLDGCIDRLEDLEALVLDLELQQGIEQALLSKVHAAQEALGMEGGENVLDDTDVEEARDALGAFLNLVEAQWGRHIDSADAELSWLFVRNILDRLGTP